MSLPIWELKFGEETIIFHDVTAKLGNVILRHYLIDDFRKRGNLSSSEFELTCDGKSKAIEYYASILIWTVNTDQPFGVIFEWLSLGIRIVAVTPKDFADQPADVILSKIEDFANNNSNIREIKVIVSQKTKFSVK